MYSTILKLTLLFVVVFVARGDNEKGRSDMFKYFLVFFEKKTSRVIYSNGEKFSYVRNVNWLKSSPEKCFNVQIYINSRTSRLLKVAVKE